jgi:hypothetical protein
MKSVQFANKEYQTLAKTRFSRRLLAQQQRNITEIQKLDEEKIIQSKKTNTEKKRLTITELINKKLAVRMKEKRNHEYDILVNCPDNFENNIKKEQNEF